MDISELKLLDILRKRYKCNIDMHFLNIEEDEGENPAWSESEKTVYRNRMAKFIINDNSILFPIYRATDSVVAIEVYDTKRLKADEVMQIKDCIELVFNDLYVLKEKRNLYKQRQTYLESHSYALNVIPLRPRQLH